MDSKPAVDISQYAGFANNPILISDPLGDTGMIPILPRDNKGIINTTTAGYYQSNPIGAWTKDVGYLGLTLLGANAIDDYIANRFNAKNNSVTQVVFETAELGITLSGEKPGAKKGVGGVMEHPVLPDFEVRHAELQAKFEKLAEEHLLPSFKKDDPNLKADYTGSFKTGNRTSRKRLLI